MNLSKDTSYLLAMKLDYETLLNLCQADKRFYNWIGKDEKFWKQKTSKDYPFLLEFKEKEQSFRHFYLEMIYYIKKIREKYDIPYIPTKWNNPKRFIKWKYDKKRALEYALCYAARGGHIDIVKHMIEKGAINFNEAMYNACKGVHMDIVKLLIEKGATDFNSAILYAAQEGNIDIVKYIVEKGAINFDSAMNYAAEGGYLDIVKYMIEKGATNFDSAMDCAAFRGHIEIVKLMIEKGARYFDNAIISAERRGHRDIVEYLKKL